MKSMSSFSLAVTCKLVTRAPPLPFSQQLTEYLAHALLRTKPARSGLFAPAGLSLFDSACDSIHKAFWCQYTTS